MLEQSFEKDKKNTFSADYSSEQTEKRNKEEQETLKIKERKQDV